MAQAVEVVSPNFFCNPPPKKKLIKWIESIYYEVFKIPVPFFSTNSAIHSNTLEIDSCTSASAK